MHPTSVFSGSVLARYEPIRTGSVVPFPTCRGAFLLLRGGMDAHGEDPGPGSSGRDPPPLSGTRTLSDRPLPLEHDRGHPVEETGGPEEAREREVERTRRSSVRARIKPPSCVPSRIDPDRFEEPDGIAFPRVPSNVRTEGIRDLELGRGRPVGATVEIMMFLVPEHLLHRTDYMVLDCMPLLTMYFCVPTLQKMYREKRSTDAIVFTAGFVVSVLYHICSIMDGGVLEAQLCGMYCSTIRDLDILAAQFVLVRTYNFLLGVDRRWVGATSALSFPLMIGYSAATDVLTLKLAARALLVSILLTTVLQILTAGIRPFHFHQKQYWSAAVVFYALGFLSFVQPNMYPEQYWLWHSLWHVFMSIGYFFLYCKAPIGEGESLQTGQTFTCTSPAETKAGSGTERRAEGIAARAHGDGLHMTHRLLRASK